MQQVQCGCGAVLCGSVRQDVLCGSVRQDVLVMNLPHPGSGHADLVRKLRSRPLSSWEFGDRSAVLRQGLDELAGMAARARGVQAPSVPDIGVHGLADQLAVLIEDALEAGASKERVDQLVASIAVSLGLSPTGTALR